MSGASRFGDSRPDPRVHPPNTCPPGSAFYDSPLPGRGIGGSKPPGKHTCAGLRRHYFASRKERWSMVRIRMQRGGRRHVNYFRINAIEKRVKRDGKVLENLGWYNSQAKDKAKQVELNIDRIKHWLAVGAQPSDTVLTLLIKANVVEGKEWADRLASRIEAVKQAAATKAAHPQNEP